MLDDLLKEKRNRFTLLELAENDGWLRDIDELPPYFIALLCFPSTEHRKKRLAFSDLITESANKEELPSKKVDAYTYNWLFNPNEFLRSFSLDVYNPLTHIKAKKGKITKPFYITVVSRNNFCDWLLKKGDFSIKQYDYLIRWFSEGGETRIGKVIPPPTVSPFKEPQRINEWTEMILAVIEHYQEEHGVFPTWGKFWGYLSKNPPTEYGVKVIGGKRGVPGKEPYVAMGESESITKDNLKDRFYRLLKPAR